VRVYAWERALPRAFVVSEALAIPDPQTRLAYLGSARFQPRQEVVLSHAHPGARRVAGPGGPDDLAPATITAYEHERVEIELPGVGGYLVLADTHYPGWRAEVDGEPRDILVANHAFRGVAVDPADRQLTFAYAPTSFRVGGWLSLMALVAYAGVAHHARRRPMLVGPPPAPLLPPWPAAALQTLLILLLHGMLVHADQWAGLLERCRFVAPS
jgi:hypothetical protein